MRPLTGKPAIIKNMNPLYTVKVCLYILLNVVDPVNTLNTSNKYTLENITPLIKKTAIKYINILFYICIFSESNTLHDPQYFIYSFDI